MTIVTQLIQLLRVAFWRILEIFFGIKPTAKILAWS